MDLSTNNLFKYATSELSQDAFIAWLLSFAMKENSDKDSALIECSREFIRKIYNIQDGEYVYEIRKQYYNIDLLVKVGDRYIIIEDKTFSDVHDDQINKYKEKLITLDEIDKDNIICVYYKIADQAKPEPGVINLFRKELLELFDSYYEKTDNPIFKDYCDYLRWIDNRSKMYEFLDISEWSKYSGVYEGFFNHMVIEKTMKTPVDGDWNWNYVSNPTGGFMCFWWQPLTKEQQKKLNIFEYISGIYLEIENDIVVVKLSSEGIEDLDDKRSIITDIRWGIFTRMKEILEKDYQMKYEKSRFQPGIHMSAGFIRYDYINYKNVIAAMEDALIKLTDIYTYEVGQGFTGKEAGIV